MILYLDTETTGLRPGNICQLSYVLQSGNLSAGRNLFFSVDYVEPSAQMVHGFSVEKLRQLSFGKSFCDYAGLIEEDFSKASIIVCHNVAFDFMFLRAEFEGVNKVFTPLNSFCTMKNSVGLCKLNRQNHAGYKYPKLTELCQYLGVTDSLICKESYRLFGECGNVHDARFDTTALFLCANVAMEKGLFTELRQNL